MEVCLSETFQQSAQQQGHDPLRYNAVDEYVNFNTAHDIALYNHMSRASFSPLKLLVRIHNKKGYHIPLVQPVPIHACGHQKFPTFKGINIHRRFRRLVIGSDYITIHAHQQSPTAARPLGW